MPFDFAFFELQQLIEPWDPRDPVLRLRDALEALGYSEESLARLYHPYAWPSNRNALWAMLRDVAGDEGFAVMVRLWSFSQWVPRALVERHLGAALVERLVYWGLLVAQGDRVAASVDICCCQGLYLVTDHHVGLGRRPHSVYPLQDDSLALARLTPRSGAARACDLCCGSGIQSLLAGRHCLTVDGVDLATRALEFARFNTPFNRLKHRLSWHQGNLFEALPDRQYDLIVANPPWVPTPDEGIELYRGGGPDGEVVTSRILRDLGGRLGRRGWLAMYVEYPLLAGSAYLERVRGWLGEGPWGVALVDLEHFTAQQYALAHVASHAEASVADELDRWMASYQKIGIEGMRWALLYVTRLSPQDPDWAIHREASFPRQSQAWVSPWLEQLAGVYRSEWRPAEQRPRVWEGARVYQERTSGEVVVTWPDTNLPPASLGADPARLLSLCDGRRSLAAIGSELNWSAHVLTEHCRALAVLPGLEAMVQGQAFARP